MTTTEAVFEAYNNDNFVTPIKTNPIKLKMPKTPKRAKPMIHRNVVTTHIPIVISQPPKLILVLTANSVFGLEIDMISERDLQILYRLTEINLSITNHQSLHLLYSCVNNLPHINHLENVRIVFTIDLLQIRARLNEIV